MYRQFLGVTVIFLSSVAIAAFFLLRPGGFINAWGDLGTHLLEISEGQTESAQREKQTAVVRKNNTTDTATSTKPTTAIVVTTTSTRPRKKRTTKIKTTRTRTTSTISSSTTTTLSSSTTTTTTTTTTTAYFKITAHSSTPLYALSDSIWFDDWSKRLKRTERTLPRVLIFTWSNDYMWSKFFNEIYWKECYARAHGFDILFTSSLHFKYDWTNLQRFEGEVARWAWVSFVQDYLKSGEYDYVFMMNEDVLIQESNLDFPVWAWDRGHAFEAMDGYHFVWPESQGYNVNNVLFKASNTSIEFLHEFFEMRKGFTLLNEQGAFMETILKFVGREQQVKGNDGYDGECSKLLKISGPYEDLMKQDSGTYSLRTESYSWCFFDQLDRLMGTYGHRKSAYIGISPTYQAGNDLHPDNFYPENLEKPNTLGPWANCWRNPRAWWPNVDKNCFAYRWNGPWMIMLPGEESIQWGTIQGQCPDKTYNWHDSRYNPENKTVELLLDLLAGRPSVEYTPLLTRNEVPMYTVDDSLRFLEWSHRNNLPDKQLPRVLIYTWCTQEMYPTFVNEIYWKACYARAHGFDVVFTSSQGSGGVRRWDWSKIEDYNDLDQWHSEESTYMWARDLQNYLFSGEYDYVFVMGADVLIQERHLNFPVWAWNEGHDITIMDQFHMSWPDAYGIHANNILFRPSDFSRQFLQEFLEFQKGFYLQSDFGPFMETILTFLGRDAVADGRPGYSQECMQHLKLEEPATSAMKPDRKKWGLQNDMYSVCFFNELKNLVGDYGSRKTKNIGFSQTFIKEDGKDVLPSERPDILGPWANCWSGLRKFWTNPDENCFAFRSEEPRGLATSEVTGKCPQPRFNWIDSPLNPANQGNSSS